MIRICYLKFLFIHSNVNDDPVDLKLTSNH